MNSRRFMGSPPQAGSRTLPHRCARTLLCIAAKLIVEWQRWVIRVALTGSKASPNVRYAFNGGLNSCVATNRRHVPGHKIAAR